jgi:hypothetical protein
MDRENSDQTKLTLNFVDFIVQPLFKKLTKLFPGTMICLQREMICFIDNIIRIGVPLLEQFEEQS